MNTYTNLHMVLFALGYALLGGGIIGTWLYSVGYNRGLRRGRASGASGAAQERVKGK